VIVQAGSSEPGRNLAARVADVVFTTHQTLASARDFYRDIRARAAGFGRAPDSLKVLVALMPVVGATQAEARAALSALDALVHPKLALARLSHALGGVDLSAYAPDAPVPRDLPRGIGMQSRRQPLLDLAARENLTLLQLAGRTAGNRGHWTLADTAGAIADHMQAWFDGGADGFLLVPPRTPESLREFAAAVVPELQRRGLFRTAYEGTTLRANLGLA
jgi:alkanesulfonate monooxygenase SsuD/methylene tetrahydromethanopterin reductase-like flavin-dependent oxidoreductase (luciferase family)